MADRVQKILAHWGVASRRSAEKMILAGRVTLNGRAVQLGDRADINTDKLCVDGQLITSAQRPEKSYYLIHKPKGVVSTCDDPRGRPTVLGLLPSKLRQGQGMHPIGRLDVQSTGALILTNDGEFTLALTHPRYHVHKLYRVWLQSKVPEAILQQWRNGILLDNQQTLPAKIKVKQIEKDKTCIEIVLTEGRNRQIRRIAEQLGYPVISLHRSAIGNIKLGDLKRGHCRPLTTPELTQLRRSTHPNTPLKSPTSVREHSV